MAKPQILYEQQLLEKLHKGDKTAFSVVFSAYYRDLIAFANTFTRLTHISEEIVQDIFVKFWDEAQSAQITTSLKSYLLKSVQNRCIDWIRHMKTRDKYSTQVLENPVLYENDTENYILLSDLENNLQKAIASLPDEMAQVFKMNRLDGMKQSEIAEKLNVSVRTVEYRIAGALAKIRAHLKELTLMLLISFNNIFNN